MTDEIKNNGTLSGGSISGGSNLNASVSASGTLEKGTVNTFTKELDPTVPEYIKNLEESKINDWNSTIDNLDIICPKNTVKEESLLIDDALDYKIFETKIEGNSYQETRKGYNLYNLYDIQAISSDHISIDENDWITATYDNTNGTEAKFLNIFNNVNNLLKENTTYNIVYEIKNFSQSNTALGSYLLILGSGDIVQFKEQIYKHFSTMSTGTFTYNRATKESFENATMSTRNFIGISPGDSVSITFRLSIIEDTSLTADTFEYEPYTGGMLSPSPDYPQEIKVTQSANLLSLDKNNWEQGTISAGINKESATRLRSKDYISIKPLTFYYVSLENWSYRWVNLTYYDKNYNFLITQEDLSPINGEKIKKIKTPENAYFVKVVVKLSNDKIITLDDIQKAKCQITEGSISKPYTDKDSISLFYRGINLFNYNDYVTADGTTGYRIHLPKGSYILSANVPFRQVKCSYSAYANWDDSYFGYHNINSKEYKININEDISSYLWLSYNDKEGNKLGDMTHDNITKFNVLLRSSQENTSNYESFIGKEQSIKLYDNFIAKIDDIQDELKIKNNQIILNKKIGKIILNGSEPWVKSGNSNENFFSGVLAVGTGLYDYIKTTYPKVLCSHFSLGNLKDNESYYIYNDFGEEGIFEAFAFSLDINKASTIEQFKEWLYNNNVTVYYVLAEPYEINLGKIDQNFITNSNINHLFLTSNLSTNIETTYALDIKKYTDKKIAELTNAIVSTGANL